MSATQLNGDHAQFVWIDRIERSSVGPDFGKGGTMDPNLYHAMLAAVGVVVSGGFTYWAGSRLLRLGQGGSGRDPAGEREPDSRAR